MSENLGRVAKKINFAQRENKKWEISEPKRKSFFFPEFIFAKTGLLSQPTTGPRKTTFYEIIKIFFYEENLWRDCSSSSWSSSSWCWSRSWPTTRITFPGHKWRVGSSPFSPEALSTSSVAPTSLHTRTTKR